MVVSEAALTSAWLLAWFAISMFVIVLNYIQSDKVFKAERFSRIKLRCSGDSLGLQY
jgi:hypothetical protein